MKLTEYQQRILRECTIDEAAYDRALAALENPQPETNTSPNIFDDLPQLVMSAIDELPVSIYIKDHKSRFVLANKYTTNLLVDNPEDIISKTDRELLYESEATYHYDMEQDLIKTGVPIIDLEIYVDEKYGDPHWYLTTKLPLRDDDGKIVGLVGINRDITKQKDVEQKLQKERNLLTTLIDNLNDQIYIKDQQGHFLMVNDTVVRMFGKSDIHDIIGKTDFELMPKSFATQFYEEEQKIFTTGKGIENREIQLTDGPLADRWVTMNKYPIFDDNGDVVMLVGINRDITDQKIAVQQQIELELSEQRKVMLGDFIVAASHEFLTPLTVIQSAAYLCSMHDNAEKRAKYVKQIETQIESLNELLHSLILVTQVEQKVDEQLVRFAFSTLYDYLVYQTNMLLRSTPRHFEHDIVSSGQAVTVHGDPVLLQKALLAIVENAVQYSTEDDTIRIRAAIHDDMIEISIQDTGVGMSTETQQRILEDFYQADKSRSGRGFGLGLSIARRIIHFHQGTIQVHSELGVGTVILVRLPVAPD